MAEHVDKRPGVKLIASFPDDEVGVGIIRHQDRVFVATTHAVYELLDNELKAIEIELEDNQASSGT